MRMSQQDLPNKSGRVINRSEVRIETAFAWRWFVWCVVFHVDNRYCEVVAWLPSRDVSVSDSMVSEIFRTAWHGVQSGSHIALQCEHIALGFCADEVAVENM